MPLLDFLKSPERQFEDLLIAALRQRDPGARYFPRRDIFGIKKADQDVTVALGVLFKEWRAAAPEARQAVVDEVVRLALIPEGPPPVEASEYLVPLLRRRVEDTPAPVSPIPSIPSPTT